MMTNISVATSESWKDKASGEKQERTEWHRIVLKSIKTLTMTYLFKLTTGDNYMNVEQLAKAIEIMKLLDGTEENSSNKTSMYDTYIGKYVICRTSNEGINFGLVEDLNSSGVILKECRRLHYHKPKDPSLSWYEGVAESGLHNDSKISGNSTKLISENYSLTLCSESAVLSIKGTTPNGS